nr:hypothetical protein [Tanacetum cinerariifolium]
MDEPAATDSSGVPSTIERSPLDFAHEAAASDQGAAAPKIPSSSPGIAAAGDPESKNASAPVENPSPRAGNKKSGSTTGDRGRNEEGRGRQDCQADQRIRRPSYPVLRSLSEQRAFVSAGCYSPGAGQWGRKAEGNV